MPAAGLLLLLDDIASVLNDVALLTKVAATKTAGVLGDDLAVNAQQVAGVHADRELPVVWAVARGSFVNKAILVPSALAISAAAPWAITPLLMCGGAFLCYEGFQKLADHVTASPEERRVEHAQLAQAVADPAVDLVAFEKDKIKGAIRTDFILSAEIIIITLGIVEEASFASQVTVLAGIAIIMTIGVYGLVAGIVKIDDAGEFLIRRSGKGIWPRLQRRVGFALIAGAPWLMKGLSVVGTAAMFLVGGAIVLHGIHALEPHVAGLVAAAASVGSIGPFLAMLAPLFVDAVMGLLIGAVVLAVVSVGKRLIGAAPLP